MNFKLLLISAFIVAPLIAQQPSAPAPPLSLNSYVPTHIISIPPVPGIPFTATVVVRSERPLADGSTEVLKTINRIGRDERGRTHGENRRVFPESYKDEPTLVEVSVYDPETHLRTSYQVATHTAQQRTANAPTGGPDSDTPNVKVENLGFKSLEGYSARGTRRTFTLPAERSGTGAPLAVVDEYWYSEDLQLNLLIRHSDPRTGVKTFTTTEISREVPPATFFDLEGYTIVSETTSH